MSGYPTLADLFFEFLGRSPYTVSPSSGRFLGTLLHALFPNAEEVNFNTAQVYDKTASFLKVIQYNATISMEGSSHAEQVCGDNPELFNLRVNFTLPPNTSLAQNRCSARPVNIPDQDYNVSETVNCVIDDSFNRKGHLDVNVRRRSKDGNPNPKISIGIGCNRNGPGVCDTKAIVKILC